MDQAKVIETPPTKGEGLKVRPGFVVLMAALSALGQLASNIYLPSLPAVAMEFSAADSLTALTYSLYLVAFAVAQLIYGPLADRYGRRPLLLFGAALFAAASVACAMAASIEALIAFRFFQAAGAAAGIVMARAMVRDVYSGAALARVMATMTIIFALAPGLSPLLGGVLQDTFGWRSIFAVVALLGSIALIASILRTTETLRSPVKRLSLSSAFSSYRAVFADATFRRNALASSFVTGAMSAFFVGSPVVFITQLGVSASEYGLYPPLAITGFIIGANITRRMAGKLAMPKIAARGLVVLCIGAILMLAFPLLGLVHKHAINVSIIIYVSGLGIFMPTVVALALERCAERAGSAAALLGFMQMGIGAIATTAVGLIQPAQPILAFPLVMFGATALAVATLGLTVERNKNPETS